MTKPSLIFPCSICTFLEKFTATISLSCLVAFNRILIEGYNHVSIVRKASAGLLIDSFPSSFCLRWIVCFNYSVFFRIIGKSRTMTEPSFIFPSFICTFLEEFTATIILSCLIAFNRILIKGYNHVTIVRKASFGLLIDSFPNSFCIRLIVCFNHGVFFRIISKSRTMTKPSLIFPSFI
jgi:hypothetical protein